MLSKMLDKLKNKPSEDNREVTEATSLPFAYQYTDFSIMLPANHMLPTYQQQHPKYDRFLPHLSKYIGPHETIIDIGANIGDTLAGMAVYNAASTYVCIEPDAHFFEQLNQNVARIKATKKNLNVHTIQALVGQNVTGVFLEGQGGTKHAVIDSTGTLQSKPLDAILAGWPEIKNIRLLKTDVDGFDYDVIDSSLATIRTYQPILFFECYYDVDAQKSGYEKTLLTLQKEGYCDWTFFDNFGGVMVRTSDLNVIMQLMDYVWHQNLGQFTRTLYYFDVLAVQRHDKDLINTVLADY